MKIHYPKINEPAEGFEMVTVKEMTVGTWYSLELENGEVEEVYIESVKVHDHVSSARHIIFTRFDQRLNETVKRIIVRTEQSPAFILENN
jgi:hypothetical protein